MSATEARPPEVRLERVVSGGQTGADRAALDAALELGVACGGWCPQGRSAEDGRLPPRYPLAETPAAEPEQRTRWNVRDAEATLVLTPTPPAGGTALAVAEARRRGRPLWIGPPEPAQAAGILAWLRDHRVRVLNVAGPRESEAPGLYAAALPLLREVIRAAAFPPASPEGKSNEHELLP